MKSSLRRNGPRILSSLALPVGVLALAFWLGSRGGEAQPWMLDAPYAALAVAAALGIRFRRTGTVLVALVLAGAWWALGALVPRHPGILPLLELLVPLNLALFTADEHPELLSPPGLIRLGLVAMQALLAACVVDPGLAAFLDVGSWLGPLSASVPVLGLGVPALAWGAAAAAAAARLVREPGPLEGGACGILAAAALGFAWRAEPAAGALQFAAAGVMAAVALVQRSYEMAYLDELTELPGRRALNEDLARLRGRYVAAMIDVDHFKSFNDTYGHEVGDQVLRLVASRIRKACAGGRPYRYGGEEFTVLYPGRTLEQAEEALEGIRRAVEETPMVLRGTDRPKKKPQKKARGSSPRGSRRTVGITVSVGAAEPEPDTRKAEQVIKAADRALYRAKQEGRNRVCLAG